MLTGGATGEESTPATEATLTSAVTGAGLTLRLLFLRSQGKPGARRTTAMALGIQRPREKADAASRGESDRDRSTIGKKGSTIAASSV